MANPNRTKTINFNVLLDPDTDGMLMRLSVTTNLSKAHVVRSLIRRNFQMHFQRRPVCADGQDCRCPHAHIYPEERDANDHLRYTDRGPNPAPSGPPVVDAP